MSTATETVAEETGPTGPSGPQSLKEMFMSDAAGVSLGGLDYIKQTAKAAVGYDEHRPTTARSLVAGQDRDLISTMLLVVVSAVIGYVGLVVMSETEGTTDFTSNSGFDNSSDSLTAGIESFFSLVEVVYIAVVLSLVIGALLFLRNARM